MRRSTAGLMAFGVLILAGSAQAAVTKTSATVFAGASVDIVTFKPNGQIKTFSPKENDDQTTLKKDRGSLEATTSVINQDKLGDYGYDHEDVYADFTNPRNGIVDLSGNSTSSSIPENKLVQAFNSGSTFDYDFTLTSSYTFSVSYSLAETDSFYSDNLFQLINTSGGPPIFSETPANGSYLLPATGIESVVLSPGSYEFGVQSRLGDISETDGVGYSVGSHVDQYDFNLVSAAPEPSTWLLLFAGVGASGIALRGRKGVTNRRAQSAF